MGTNGLNNLTAAETTNLWNTYLNDTAAICQLNHQLQHVEDSGIKEVLQRSLEISESRVEKIKVFLIKKIIQFLMALIFKKTLIPQLLGFSQMFTI